MLPLPQSALPFEREVLGWQLGRCVIEGREETGMDIHLPQPQQVGGMKQGMSPLVVLNVPPYFPAHAFEVLPACFWAKVRVRHGAQEVVGVLRRQWHAPRGERSRLCPHHQPPMSPPVAQEAEPVSQREKEESRDKRQGTSQ